MPVFLTNISLVAMVKKAFFYNSKLYHKIYDKIEASLVPRRRRQRKELS
jgi:hypothetical protein